MENTYPENGFQSLISTQKHPNTKKRSEPSYAISTAVQIVYEALTSAMCRPPKCQEKHQYSAQLSVCTYRVPVPEDSVNLDMVLAVEQLWREAVIRTPVRKTCVTFALNDESQQDKEKTLPPDVSWRVKTLCETIIKISSWPSSWRLKFAIKDTYLPPRGRRSVLSVALLKWAPEVAPRSL